MSIEPIAALIEKLTSERSYDDIIYMTPDGKVLDQNDCNQMSLCDNIMILCGPYKGVDDRIRQHYITKEISIGSYVLSGGELAAAVVVDAVVEVDIGLARRLDEQHLVEADAEVAVGHLPDLCGAELDRVRDKIEHHEVVAEAVHFGER